MTINKDDLDLDIENIDDKEEFEEIDLDVDILKLYKDLEIKRIIIVNKIELLQNELTFITTNISPTRNAAINIHIKENTNYLNRLIDLKKKVSEELYNFARTFNKNDMKLFLDLIVREKSPSELARKYDVTSRYLSNKKSAFKRELSKIIYSNTL